MGLGFRVWVWGTIPLGRGGAVDTATRHHIYVHHIIYTYIDIYIYTSQRRFNVLSWEHGFGLVESAFQGAGDVFVGLGDCPCYGATVHV